MDNDDIQVGRLLSRRELLALIGVTGAVGAALIAGCSDNSSTPATPTSARTLSPTATATRAATSTAAGATSIAAAPSCVVRPAETEGPYFVDEKINRSDIRSDTSDGSVKPGAPLTIAFNVSTVGNGTCVPLSGATVDVWHCDAAGVYSDVSDPGFATVGKTFLRGYQVTDAAGSAKFTTIYPGWYQGRTVHIHFKIRTTTAAGKAFEFTSQLFFDDALTDQVFARAPYAAKGQRTLRNDGDGIYRTGGDQLLLDVAKSGDTYAATFDIGLQMS